MKKLCTLIFFIHLGIISFAQTATAEDSVKLTINMFFEGMKTSDTTLIRSTMADGVIFQTITRQKNGELMVKTEDVGDFLKYIATPQKAVADERITFETIKIDGALASVWTPYKFYAGEKFSHCGANSFQLVKIKNLWKIQYLIDTRRRQGCE